MSTIAKSGARNWGVIFSLLVAGEREKGNQICQAEMRDTDSKEPKGEKRKNHHENNNRTK